MFQRLCINPKKEPLGKKIKELVYVLTAMQGKGPRSQYVIVKSSGLLANGNMVCRRGQVTVSLRWVIVRLSLYDSLEQLDYMQRILTEIIHWYIDQSWIKEGSFEEAKLITVEKRKFGRHDYIPISKPLLCSSWRGPRWESQTLQNTAAVRYISVQYREEWLSDYSHLRIE